LYGAKVQIKFHTTNHKYDYCRKVTQYEHKINEQLFIGTIN
jgi:hypothetical protein